MMFHQEEERKSFSSSLELLDLNDVSEGSLSADDAPMANTPK
jgi:hypothetical protein